MGEEFSNIELLLTVRPVGWQYKGNSCMAMINAASIKAHIKSSRGTHCAILGESGMKYNFRFRSLLELDVILRAQADANHI